MSCCDEATAQGFADCEALVVAMLSKMAENATTESYVALTGAALAVSLGQHRSAETNESAVLSAHRTAVNRAQAQAAGRASAAKRWGKGAKK